MRRSLLFASGSRFAIRPVTLLSQPLRALNFPTGDSCAMVRVHCRCYFSPTLALARHGPVAVSKRVISCKVGSRSKVVATRAKPSPSPSPSKKKKRPKRNSSGSSGRGDSVTQSARARPSPPRTRAAPKEDKGSATPLEKQSKKKLKQRVPEPAIQCEEATHVQADAAERSAPPAARRAAVLPSADARVEPVASNSDAHLPRLPSTTREPSSPSRGEECSPEFAALLEHQSLHTSGVTSVESCVLREDAAKISVEVAVDFAPHSRFITHVRSTSSSPTAASAVARFGSKLSATGQGTASSFQHAQGKACRALAISTAAGASPDGVPLIIRHADELIAPPSRLELLLNSLHAARGSCGHARQGDDANGGVSSPPLVAVDMTQGNGSSDGDGAALTLQPDTRYTVTMGAGPFCGGVSGGSSADPAPIRECGSDVLPLLDRALHRATELHCQKMSVSHLPAFNPVKGMPTPNIALQRALKHFCGVRSVEVVVADGPRGCFIARVVFDKSDLERFGVTWRHPQRLAEIGRGIAGAKKTAVRHAFVDALRRSFPEVFAQLAAFPTFQLHDTDASLQMHALSGSTASPASTHVTAPSAPRRAPLHVLSELLAAQMPTTQLVCKKGKVENGMWVVQLHLREPRDQRIPASAHEEFNAHESSGAFTESANAVVNEAELPARLVGEGAHTRKEAATNIAALNALRLLFPHEASKFADETERVELELDKQRFGSSENWCAIDSSNGGRGDLDAPSGGGVPAFRCRPCNSLLSVARMHCQALASAASDAGGDDVSIEELDVPIVSRDEAHNNEVGSSSSDSSAQEESPLRTISSTEVWLVVSSRQSPGCDDQKRTLLHTGVSRSGPAARLQAFQGAVRHPIFNAALLSESDRAEVEKEVLARQVSAPALITRQLVVLRAKQWAMYLYGIDLQAVVASRRPCSDGGAALEVQLWSAPPSRALLTSIRTRHGDEARAVHRAFTEFVHPKAGHIPVEALDKSFQRQLLFGDRGPPDHTEITELPAGTLGRTRFERRSVDSAWCVPWAADDAAGASAVATSALSCDAKLAILLGPLVLAASRGTGDAANQRGGGSAAAAAAAAEPRLSSASGPGPMLQRYVWNAAVAAAAIPPRWCAAVVDPSQLPPLVEQPIAGRGSAFPGAVATYEAAGEDEGPLMCLSCAWGGLLAERGDITAATIAQAVQIRSSFQLRILNPTVDANPVTLLPLLVRGHHGLPIRISAAHDPKRCLWQARVSIPAVALRSGLLAAPSPQLGKFPDDSQDLVLYTAVASQKKQALRMACHTAMAQNFPKEFAELSHYPHMSVVAEEDMDR